MKIYTRQGDRGETGLLGGLRVGKDDPVIRVCGALDETNSAIGLARSHGLPPEVDRELAQVQRDLFAIGAALAAAFLPEDRPRRRSRVRLAEGRTEVLEGWIDRWDRQLEPLQAFILPGGGLAGATLHWARAVCRRAESEWVGLERARQLLGTLDHERIYLNRLSDFLFVLARIVNRGENRSEMEWIPGQGG